MPKNKIEKQPLVSVVIATYNREKYIKRAIESVLNQTYKNIEVIIIDDSSADKTKNIISELNQKHTGIIYIKNKNRIGFIKSLNKGIETAKGKYIARIDDDDFWCDPQKLEKQVNFLEKNQDYILVGGRYILIDETGQKVQRFLPETDEEIRKAILFACPFPHSAIVFRKDSWGKIGGYNECYSEDWDFELRLGKLGKFYNFPEYFVYILREGQNKTPRYARQNLKFNLRLRKKYRNDYPNFSKAFLLAQIRYFYSFLPQSLRQFLTPVVSKIRKIFFPSAL